MKKNLITTLLLILFMSISSFNVYAGVVFNPVSVKLQSSSPIRVMKVRNTSKEEAVSFQVFRKQWFKNRGKDVLKDTKDIIVTPPIFTLMPGQEQIIRVGYIGGKLANYERLYRVFFRQIKVNKHVSLLKKLKRRKLRLEVLLNVGIPVVLLPAGPIDHKVSWALNRMKKNRVKWSIMNNGNVHLRIDGVQLKSEHSATKPFNKKMLLVIFPHQSETVMLDLPSRLLHEKKLELSVASDWGKLTNIVNLK